MDIETAIKQILDIANEPIEEANKFLNIEKLISQMNDDAEVRGTYISVLVDTLIVRGHRYSDLNEIRNDIHFIKAEHQIRHQPEASYFYLAFIDFINGHNESCINNINKLIKDSDEEFAYFDLLNIVRYFKQGFPGMWTSIADTIRSVNAIRGFENAARSMELFYYSNQQEEIVDALSVVICENEDIVFAKEMIGFTYYAMKRWKNSIAYFEQMIEKDLNYRAFEDDELYFYLAYSYGKIKDRKKEEVYYRKQLIEIPNASIALNNLGYCLYQQKKFSEARKIFERKVEERIDLRFSVNNLLRVLIALGEDDEATKLAVKYKDYASRDLIRRIGHTRKSREIVVEDNEANDENQLIQIPSLVNTAQAYQFSSERRLEDELTFRLEKGQNCFGVPLSVYQRKGMYGRQFITPVGRIDILANDQEGNLYAIELKKDSGYGDVLEQVNRYINWLEKNMIQPGKKVYGFIVLNQPTEDLRMNVKSNSQLKLFEYTISYKEIS